MEYNLTNHAFTPFNVLHSDILWHSPAQRAAAAAVHDKKSHLSSTLMRLTYIVHTLAQKAYYSTLYFPPYASLFYKAIIPPLPSPEARKKLCHY